MAVNWEQYRANNEESAPMDWEQYRATPPKSEEPKKINNVMDFLKNAGSQAWEDVKKIPGYLGKKGVDIINAAPSEAPGVVNQLTGFKPTLRPLKNLLINTSNIEKGIINTPSNMAKYMEHLGLLLPEYANKVPRMEKEPVGEYIKGTMGEQQPGDVALQHSVDALMLLHPEMNPLMKLPGKTYQKVAGNITGVAKKAALQEKLNIPGKTEALEQATSAKEAAQVAEKEAQEIAKEATGKADVGTMKYARKEAINAKAGLEQPESLPISAEEAGLKSQAAELAHEQAEKNVTAAENEIGEHLNKGAAHDVRAAAAIDTAQEAIHSGISKEYKDIEKSLADKSVEITNSRHAKDIIGEIENLVKEGKAQSKEASQLVEELNNLKEKEIIPANDYLTAFRSMRDYAREARSKAYEPGMNAEERAAWKKRYDELDAKVDEMGEALESGIGKKDAARLKNANKNWREKVVPLYKNTTYQTIKKRGRMPDNIMKTLRGTDPGDVIMRNIIKNDPELLKNVLGQRFAEKPSALHTAGELEQEYIKHAPELQQKMQNHKQAVEHLPKAKEAAQNAKSFHEEAIKHEERIHEYNEQKIKLENKIEKLENHIAILKDRAANKKLTAREHFKAVKDLQAAKKELKDAKFGLSKFTKFAGKVLMKAGRKIAGVL